MGIKPFWQQSVITNLETLGIDLHYIESSEYHLLFFSKECLIINLISLNSNYLPTDLISLQESYQLRNICIVHLWEDVWQMRKLQIIGRVASILGLNKRIHARKTKVIPITQKQADDFLNENHLQSSAKSKYKFALNINDNIVAVACFSKLRPMKRIAPDYRSVELIRFASLTGYTIIGGLSKLLQHFIKIYMPNDVMSYADRDWSLGKAYEQLGFTLSSITAPSEIWLKQDNLVRYFPHRLPADFLKDQVEMSHTNTINDEYLKVFNTGNLKYILYL